VPQRIAGPNVIRTSVGLNHTLRALDLIATAVHTQLSHLQAKKAAVIAEIANGVECGQSSTI
jgi:hypothetical protein